MASNPESQQIEQLRLRVARDQVAATLAAAMIAPSLQPQDAFNTFKAVRALLYPERK